jgi:radical SAM superfamily enzyme YgiQ (UPF0313 family)
MYVAAYINKYSDYKVEILDAACEKIDYSGLYKEVQRRNPKVVGVYTSTFSLYDSYKVAKLVKEVSHGITVILGGPHIEIYPEESLNLPEIDFVVISEGEISFTELINCLVKKKDFSLVKGIGYKKNGSLYFTERRPMISNLDELPFPVRQLTGYHRYYSFIGSKKIATTIMSSRGCPHRCSFCYIPYQGSLRMRSAKSVISEIEECIKLGIKEFFFFDENFTINEKLVIDICDEIISNRLNIIFYIRSRIDTVSEEMLKKLKKAGCQRIQFGVESGSPRILKIMNKKINLEQIEKTFEMTKKIGIPTFADFMLGYPGETEEEIELSIKFAKKIDPDFVQYGVTMFLPQTKIYEDALKNRLLKEDYWRIFARTPNNNISYPLASSDYGRNELEKIQRKAYISFYLRPKYILKRLSLLKNIREFIRQLKAGFQLLGGKTFI